MAKEKEPTKSNSETKKSGTWWAKLPSTEKFMLVGAAALVAYFAIRAMMGGSSGTPSTSTPVVGSSGSGGSTGETAAISSLASNQSQLAQQMTQQLQTLQQQNAAALQAVSEQNAAQIAAMQQSLSAAQSQTASQYQNQLTGIQSLLGKMATGSGGTASNPSTAGSVPSYPSKAGSVPTSLTYYMPGSTPKSVVNEVEHSANTHVVGLPTGGYVAATGANNYNASVNAAGGQWLKATNGKSYFYRGFYNGNHFVSNSVNNPAPASNGPNTVVSTTHGYLIYPKGQVPSNLTNVKS